MKNLEEPQPESLINQELSAQVAVQTRVRYISVRRQNIVLQGFCFSEAEAFTAPIKECELVKSRGTSIFSGDSSIVSERRAQAWRLDAKVLLWLALRYGAAGRQFPTWQRIADMAGVHVGNALALHFIPQIRP